MGPSESEATNKLAPPKPNQTSGHVGEMDMRLVRTHETIGNQATIQRTPQTVVILDMYRVEAGVILNGAAASDHSDQCLVLRGNNHYIATNNAEAIRVRVPHAMGVAELNWERKVTVAHRQRSYGAGDYGKDAV